MSKPLHDPLSKQFDEEGQVAVRNTTCYMCACRCGIRVTLRDGEIRYIQGHSDAEFTHGICPDCKQKSMVEVANYAKKKANTSQ